MSIDDEDSDLENDLKKEFKKEVEKLRIGMLQFSWIIEKNKMG